MAYICTGFMNPQIWAIGLDGRGDVSQTHVKFKIPKQVPATPSPVLANDQLYFISDQGVATSEINNALLATFRERGIAIPVPQREVRLIGGKE